MSVLLLIGFTSSFSLHFFLTCCLTNFYHDLNCDYLLTGQLNKHLDTRVLQLTWLTTSMASHIKKIFEFRMLATKIFIEYEFVFKITTITTTNILLRISFIFNCEVDA